eukprot:CAMPEP_0170457318 /NCGR_PEP_ID=MMETSP0123-20130129/4652_1 /TAXON_ID=182087 /ORGANISM="Favella ehrenbergii, Strain Fehren 1" /LENGTH=51 /DNA_ID=CAMNT_0010721075 /DNA_START=23 /DNA_END=178 /DNA_ORIENTATION=-
MANKGDDLDQELRQLSKEVVNLLQRKEVEPERKRDKKGKGKSEGRHSKAVQ